MYTYLIEYNNKIIGVYNDYDIAKINIKSFFYNNFISNNIIIKIYYTNSCLLYKEEYFYNEFSSINDIDLNINKLSNIINNQTIDNSIQTIDNSIQTIDNNHKINFNFNQIIKEYNKDSEINYNLVEEIKNKKINEQKDLQHNINLLKIKKDKMKELKSIYENDFKLFNLFNENKLKSDTFVIPCMFEKKYNLFKKLLNENNLSCHTFIKEYNNNESNNDNIFIKQNIDEEFEVESDSETTLT